MIYLASFLFGGISGVVLWCYVSEFITCLQKDIYDAYIELFPEKCPIFSTWCFDNSTEKCGHILVYFFSVGFLFLFLHLILKNESLLLWAGVVLLMLWTMSYLDLALSTYFSNALLSIICFRRIRGLFLFFPFIVNRKLAKLSWFLLCFWAHLWRGKSLLWQGSFW